MSYVALYRKFRPSAFEQVKGQDHVVKTLKNQLNNNRIGHAYLFTGTRGTGKTSVAKLFAKAANCENPVDGNPCGECPSCQAIAKGASLNVIEIDAASNNRVDDVRQIIEEVQYSPVDGKYKIYIIDEVHMLTIGAFNALLKTLEEPPAYAIFILATTEVNKLPITILSRCQRYDFRRISIDTITDRLRELMDTEGRQVEDRALKYIAKVADGSMRDALSLLDQCLAFYYEGELTYERALEVLGAVDTSVFSKLLDTIINKDTLGAINILGEVMMWGKELGQFVNDFSWYLRSLLITKTTNNMSEDLLGMSSENMEQLKKEAEMLTQDEIIRYINVFSELSANLKGAAQKQIIAEIALIKLTKPQMENSYEALVERISKIEKDLEEGNVKVNSTNFASVSTAPVVTKAESDQYMEFIPEEYVLPADISYIVKNIDKLACRLEGRINIYFKKGEIKFATDGSNKLIVVTTSEMAAHCFEGKEEIEEFKEFVSEIFQMKIPIEHKRIEKNSESNKDLMQIPVINMKIMEE